MGNSQAKNWKEISGENNWEGLLDPPDMSLRQFIIHSGERCQALKDAFIGEKASKWYGFSRYAPEEFFSNVCLETANPYKYNVTDFFYARSAIKILSLDEAKSAWMGYVAVATDEAKALLGRRDILICWRGTELDTEWFENFDFKTSSASEILGSGHDPYVHEGFMAMYMYKSAPSTYNKMSAREQVLKVVRKLADKYEDEEISITIVGHSLGAALATLNAADIVANGYNKPSTDQADKAFLVTAIVFGSPRVGDQGFKNLISGLNNLRILRVRNQKDFYPDVPPEGPLFNYVHVGQELVIDTTKSPYVKNSVGPHNLELHLHGVAGTQGNNAEFKLVVDLDIALINKWADGLKDEYKVPASWWTVKNKGMVQQKDGSWKLEEDYVPDPPIA